MPIIINKMDKQIDQFYERNAAMFKRPLEEIINKMLKDCCYINDESIERHNYGDKPVQLTNLPTNLNSDDYENELIKSLKKSGIEDKSIIELLWGDIQLGKRIHACIIMWISTYILKRPVLYIFRNLKIDKSQLMDDISGVNEHDFNIIYIRNIFDNFTKKVSDNWKEFKLPELKDIDNNDNLNKLSNKEKLDPKDILCCLMNHTQLEKINLKLSDYIKENNELINLTVITDESDLYAPSASNDNKHTKDIIDATKCEKLLCSIYLKVRYVLHITGTAHSLLYNTTTRLNEGQSIHMNISKVHKMKRKKGYYGLFNGNINYNTTINEWWNEINPETGKKYKYDIQMDYHVNIKSIIKEIIHRPNTKYNSLLISEEKIRKGQFELVNEIISDFTNLFLIVFHGKCLRLYIPKIYINYLLKYSKEEKRLFKQGGIYNASQFKDKDSMKKLVNEYCYTDIDEKEFNIKQLYKILSLMIRNVKNISKTVVTITGKYGERGYSFTSDDYGDNIFHITDQYYPCHVKTKNCTDISQRLRIQGKYNDNPILKLWTTTTLEDIMKKFYIPFMKQIENDIMECENYEEIRDLIEGIIDTREHINFDYMKYIGPSKYKKNIKKEKRFDSKHKGYRLIRFDGLSEERISHWCSEHNLPPYECINNIKNDLSKEGFIEKCGDYKPINVIEDSNIDIFCMMQLSPERRRKKLINRIKTTHKDISDYTLDRIIKCTQTNSHNDLNRIKSILNNPTSNYIREKQPKTYNIIYHEEKELYSNILITGLTDIKVLPRKTYKKDKAYYIDENDNVFYSKLKTEYEKDENYEESPYYWKTPDGWLYLYDPKKPVMMSINIKREEGLDVQETNEPIIIDENIRKYKEECISKAHQSNIRIGINIVTKHYKDWCSSKNITPLTRKKVKEELVKVNIKEEISKGIDSEGNPGKRGYNISLKLFI